MSEEKVGRRAVGKPVGAVDGRKAEVKVSASFAGPVVLQVLRKEFFVRERPAVADSGPSKVAKRFDAATSARLLHRLGVQDAVRVAVGRLDEEPCVIYVQVAAREKVFGDFVAVY